MAQHTVGDIMTPDPATCASGTSVTHAAQLMRDRDVGDVVVVDDVGQAVGILTDRDIAIRVVADGRAADAVRVEEVCTGVLVTADDRLAVDEAVRRMRDHNIRRLVVVRHHEATPPLPASERRRLPVGVLSLADLGDSRPATGLT